MKKTMLISFLFFVLLSSAQKKYAKGMDFDDETYSVIPQKAKLTRGLEIVPAAVSLKAFAPIPANQGGHGTCTSWAAAYCGRTIMEAIKNNWKDVNSITKNAYSAPFLFRMLKPEDSICSGGSSIAEAFLVMKDHGSLKNTNTPGLCFPKIKKDQLENALSERIKDYMRIFNTEDAASIKVQSVRKSISEKKPVVIGMICPESFMNSKELWEPKEEPLKTYGGHAMCVVGYDDTKYGGAFEIQNSWGTSWGNKGYVWIKYADFAKFTKYAFQFIDLPEPKPLVADLSGQIKLMLSDGKMMPVILNSDSTSSTYKTSESYTYGSRFRIYISNNEPAYVYAISTDLSNEIVKIFPYTEGISAALTDKKNEVPIPDEDHFIQFDNKPGTDILCVLYSRDALNINELTQKMAQEKGTFNERVYKVLADKLVEAKNITYAKETIAFKGFSKGKTIIPLIVVMEHQ